MKLRRLTTSIFLRGTGQREFLQCLKVAEANQWKSQQELQELQWGKFLGLLKHATEKVPYYRKLFKKYGIDLSTIRTRDDLAKIPILTKTEVQHHEDKLLVEGIDKTQLTKKTTSGSTGAPTVIYIDHDRAVHSGAYNLRHNRWAGYDWGCKVGSIWGARRHSFTSEGANGWRKRLRDLKGFLLGRVREIQFSPFYYLDEHMDQFAETLISFQPNILLGYSNSLYFLAKHFSENDIQGVHLRGIICGGETLTPEARKLLESVFESKVFLRYGSREFDIIASECDHGGLHVNDDNLLVEVLKEPGKKTGRILVTDLNNYAMPLIRYDTEDIASTISGSCPCGRGLSLLGGIVGRESEILKTRDGGHISGIWFHALIDEIPQVRKYQVRQLGYESFQLKVILGSEKAKQDFIAVTSEIKKVFGQNTAVDIKYVKEIPEEESGKYRFVISDVR